jgi:hypothetical protein
MKAQFAHRVSCQARLVAAWFFVALAMACAGTETGNPGAQATARVRVSANLPLPPSDISGRLPLLVEQAYLNIQSLTSLGCSSGATPVLDAAGVQLFPSPSETMVMDAIEACGYRIDLVAQAIGPDTTKESASILIVGKSSEGQSVTVKSSASHSFALSVLAPPLSIAPDSSWLFRFDLSSWVENLDLGGLQPGPDGIRIDETSHPELLAPLVAALGAGLALRRDLDGDGQIDPQDVVVAGPP